MHYPPRRWCITLVHFTPTNTLTDPPLTLYEWSPLGSPTTPPSSRSVLSWIAWFLEFLLGGVRISSIAGRRPGSRKKSHRLRKNFCTVCALGTEFKNKNFLQRIKFTVGTKIERYEVKNYTYWGLIFRHFWTDWSGSAASKLIKRRGFGWIQNTEAPNDAARRFCEGERVGGPSKLKN